MAKKKKKDGSGKPKKGSSDSLGFIKEALTLIGGLAGSILAVYGLVKTFKEDATGFSWLIPVGIVIWLMILWRLFQTRKAMAYSLFIISMLAGVIGWIGWKSQVRATQEKIIVLVTEFDGPENNYGLQRQIVEDLRVATKSYLDTSIIESTVVAVSSEQARELGKEENADLVIWAWYRPTDDPNITVHVENLSPIDITSISESEMYQPQATLAQLETFEIQRQLGSETSTLVSFLTGMMRFKAADFQEAIVRFDYILEADDVSTFIDRYDLLYNLGYANEALGNYQTAIQHYDLATDINPQRPEAYESRGVIYAKLGEFERSFQDFDKAIEVDSEYTIAYNDRGFLYSILGDYERAIQDLDKAVATNPEYLLAYTNRGKVYGQLGRSDLAFQDFNKAIEINAESSVAYSSRGLFYGLSGDYERAVQDFDRAIEIEPRNAFLYTNRGNAYIGLNKYSRAIQDYESAIELGMQDASIYSNRGMAYSYLGDYNRALQDLNKAIQIDPTYEGSYYNRGLIYQQLGKGAEAQADFKKYEELTGQKP